MLSLAAKANGISKVIVKGTPLYLNGKQKGVFPGQVLRTT